MRWQGPVVLVFALTIGFPCVAFAQDTAIIARQKNILRLEEEIQTLEETIDPVRRAAAQAALAAAAAACEQDCPSQEAELARSKLTPTDTEMAAARRRLRAVVAERDRAVAALRASTPVPSNAAKFGKAKETYAVTGRYGESGTLSFAPDGTYRSTMRMGEVGVFTHGTWKREGAYLTLLPAHKDDRMPEMTWSNDVRLIESFSAQHEKEAEERHILAVCPWVTDSTPSADAGKDAASKAANHVMRYAGQGDPLANFRKALANDKANAADIVALLPQISPTQDWGMAKMNWADREFVPNIIKDGAVMEADQDRAILEDKDPAYTWRQAVPAACDPRPAELAQRVGAAARTCLVLHDRMGPTRIAGTGDATLTTTDGRVLTAKRENTDDVFLAETADNPEIVEIALPLAGQGKGAVLRVASAFPCHGVHMVSSRLATDDESTSLRIIEDGLVMQRNGMDTPNVFKPAGQ